MRDLIDHSIPTTDGPKGGVVAYTVDRVGITGFISVSDRVYGSGKGPFTFISTRGDCVRAPLTRFRWQSTQITFSS